MPCPRCSGPMYQPPDEDGDYACLCGFRLYRGQDASEVYWKQLQANLGVVVVKEPPKDRRAGRQYHRRFKASA